MPKNKKDTDLLAGKVTVVVLIILAVVYVFWGLIFAPADIRVILQDAHGAELPTEYTDAFKIYLIESSDESDPEHVVSHELTSGVTQHDISIGSYNLQVHCDSASLAEDQETLFYDEPVHLYASGYKDIKVQLKNIALFYQIYVAPPDFHIRYQDIATDKVVIKEVTMK